MANRAQMSNHDDWSFDRRNDRGGYESSDSEDAILDLELRQPVAHNDLHSTPADTDVLLHQDSFGYNSGISVIPASYRAAACVRYLKSPAFMIYCCQGLSSWGYRMWRFAIGLYLVEIAMDSLRLAATYGLILCISSLMFSPLVGDWVDRTKRIRAIRVAIFLQNCCLILCSLLLAMVLVLEGNIKLIWNGVLFVMVEIMIVILGDCANLAGEAERISIRKDWVVVVAGTNKSKLANLNAVLLRIDLVINIVAPIAIGAVMTYSSMLTGALVIAAWNLIAGCVEYYLMSTVYKAVPALRIKKSTTMNEAAHADEKVNINQSVTTTPGDQMFSVGSDSEPSDAEVNISHKDLSQHHTQGNVQEANESPIRDTEQIKEENLKKVVKVFGLCITLGKGWKTYMSYTVWSAGFGLAFLYMTVLGFDSITTGYAYSQGLAEWVIGVLMALGSVFGLLGTAMFTRLREKIGLQRTGLWALIGEISCLSLCVISVWAPGSPLNLDPQTAEDFIANISTAAPLTTLSAFNTSQLMEEIQDIRHKPDSYVSVTLLFTGMALSRTGLWLFDLAVTQLIQESVLETQRGIFSGVQNSLNGFMDLVHFALVISFPNPNTFGVLIIVSFLFVCAGAGFFAYYSYKVRGHLFHCVKCTTTTSNSNGYTIQDTEAESI